MKMRALSVLGAAVLSALSLVAFASPSAAQLSGSSTAITSSPSSLIDGSEMSGTFTVKVSSLLGLLIAATGPVDLSATQGSTTVPLCSFTLASGDDSTGSCSPTSDTVLGAGSYEITATYEGDLNYLGSTSPQVPMTIDQPSTTTAVTPTPSSTTYGNETTESFGVAVTPVGVSGSPTGLVTVMAGSVPVCNFTLVQSDNGVGSCTTSSDTLLGAGPYQITAVYGGDGTYGGSTSPQVPLTVDQASTTATVTPTPSTTTYGNESTVSFGVTVTPQFSGAPTGLVSVMAGTTPLCTVTLTLADNGSGSCSTTDTALAASMTPYGVTATYGGDPNFTASLPSPPSDLTVDQASTTATVTPTPSTIAYGNESTVSFGVTVGGQFGGVPVGGTVSVVAGSTPLCTFTLTLADDGSGSCSTTDTALAASMTPYGVTATYGGDPNFAASLPSPPSDLTVTTASSSTAVTPTPSSTTYGNETTESFGVAVTPVGVSGSPTGLVTVMAGSVPVCNFTLVQSDNGVGSCTTSSDTLLGAGPYQITAVYGGDGTYGGSTSPQVPLTVDQASTTATVTPTPSTTTYGNESTVSFGVTVTPQFSGAPTGLVSVMAGTTPLCTVTLTLADNGSGSCSTTDTALAASMTPYGVTATYGGDPNFTASLPSPPSDLTVDQASTTATVTPTPSTIAYGNESTVSFGVTVGGQFGGVPVGGTVSVVAGSTPLCTFTLTLADDGSGSCSTTDTALAASMTPYGVTATYGGDPNFTASLPSPPSDLTVDQASTTATVTPTPSTIAYGNESTVSFGVTVGGQFGGVPVGGTVSVVAGSTPLCTFTLTLADDGSGSCTTGDETLPASSSPYAVTAMYEGDTNFSASPPSPSSTLTVLGGNSMTQLALSNSSVTYGDETVENFTVTVTPLKAGTPQGTVTVAVPGTQLCSGTLPADGIFECPIASATALGTSTTAYTVTATFASSDNSFFGSASTSTLTVDQATTGMTFGVSPSSVTYNGESTATFTATLAPQYPPSTPTGSITVAVGSTTLCSITLPATHCNSTNQAALGAGSYTVTATYHGDPNFKSSSGGQGFTVNRATPSSPNISNVPGGAAEEGSFTASVATTGDGSTSVVSDTTGTCTVGGDGRTVSFLVEGACTLTPQVSSGANYTAGTGSPQTFTILPGPRGYWLVGSDGGIFTFGQANFYGSMGGIPLQRPVVGITPTHDKQGYWLVASDGGIFSFGDSNYYGSIPGLGIHPAGSGQADSLDAPIVGMVPSSDGNGYFMVASDGGVFAFGDAKFAGSCPGIGGCAGSAVAVMPDHSGNGYWLVTSAGDIYAFGDAPFFGAPSPQSSPVVNAVATTDGHGYWILYANGTVLPFGDAGSLGNPVGYVNSFNPATSIFPTSDGLGYWVASAKGDVFTYGNAPFLGSMSATPLNGPIIAAFGF